MKRTPTRNQYSILRNLGNGAALVVGRKREIEPMLRRGWVTSRADYAWVRITPDGLRALADAVEQFGLPDFNGETGA